MSANRYLLDFSLGIVNRTGAYYLARDLFNALPDHFAEVRFWRLLTRQGPEGLTRKVIARLMMIELERLRDSPNWRWPEGSSPQLPKLFLDPLYVLRSRLKPQDIVQCLDVGPISHPDLFHPSVTSLYTDAYRKISQVGPGMVFISDASQSEFRALYGDRFRFMQTVALYARQDLHVGAVEPLPGVKPPFLLTVGALELRKNYPRVIEAYRESGLRERGVQYVFCGARGEGADQIEALAATTPGVKQLGYVTDPQLRWLYANAAGFVLPSLLEGFGLPIIEAAQRGLVPVVSAGGAQQEAIGPAGLFVDPLSVESIRQGMLDVVALPQAEKTRRLTLATKRASELTFDRYVRGWERVLTKNDRFADTDGWARSDPEERP